MIDDETKMAMKMNLEVEECKLKHDEPRPAVDYVCRRYGDITLSIPICEECVELMMDDEHVLLYCENCHSNHWIHVPSSMRQYHYEKGEKIKWMPACPYCSTITQEEVK